MSYSKVLKNLMVSYIDGEQLASSTLKEKLQLTTPDVRYELLRDVRGVVNDSCTGVLTAADLHDLEGLQVMLDGLTPAQKHSIVKIPNSYNVTALLFAVDKTSTHCSSIEIIECLLRDLSPEQQFQLYITSSDRGNTALHQATYHNKADVVQRILNSCTRQQKIELLSIRNKAGQSVADRSVPALFSTVQALDETREELNTHKRSSQVQVDELRQKNEEQTQALEKTNKALADAKTTSDVQAETILQLKKDNREQKQALDETKDELNRRKISSQVQVDELRLQNDQLKQELQQTNKALTDVKKTSDVQVETNLQLKKDREEQTKVTEETKKDLAALQETSNKQIEELKKQQTQALEETKKGQEETKKELADVQKSNNELVVELVRRNMQLERDNNQQTQVIQALSARQAAMEQMLERLELEFRRPIVTDETGDQENEDY